MEGGFPEIKGFSNEEIADLLAVNKRSVSKINHTYANTLDVGDPKRKNNEYRQITGNNITNIKDRTIYDSDLKLNVQALSVHCFLIRFCNSCRITCCSRIILFTELVARQRNELHHAAYRRFVSQFKLV